MDDLRLAVEAHKKWEKHGYITLTTWKEYEERCTDRVESHEDFLKARGIKFEPRDEQMVLDYDYIDDEMTDLEREEFQYVALWGIARQYLHDYAFDGSGNGLYYGLIIFK